MTRHCFSRALFLRVSKTRQSGFSLIEIALVLVIVGLALGGIVAAIGPQLDNKNVRDTQERIKQASEAITAFAIANRRLPCPASAASNGDEVVVGLLGQCANFNNGFVPARTLGLGDRGANGTMLDAWGFGIRYSVTQVTYTGAGNAPVSINCGATCYPFTQLDGIKNAYYLNGAATPPQPAVAQLQQVCASSTGITATTCGAAAANLVVQPAFLVWSTARNGAQLPGGAGADEAANLNGDVVYVMHPRTEPTATNGAFDDILQWQTVATVFLNFTNMGVLK
ncbi:MAG: prepilin-type N-terminal cleavage/methylation domain-containing protein [Polaromonas sp.]|uniref:type II secretion system protein n=1 Tax=Polaromonas sp. TaxID=1869339 RepID=UPI002730CA04|nr:prepilin-type N-terminal cleavage/methylation domain-containing protein [Polaromonas sp.]MDP1742334.1 prepilin-type N-terminal cleavage/methylation domain-containing protein [Polaromonas sp.]MDP1954474.1 prepilin-type N-terminal cleavage/methylation domain-containing protein [Polaromonas sp.]MDP3753557.1 prepilin-type N-terminal cleavage/methylation domain-containing protein [Polaromonas sp.]